MRKAKSLDELYNEVKEYDKVVTVDVGLADGLNRRLDKPVLGEFAVTPKNFASSERTNFQKDIFLRLVDDLNLTWKQASFILNKALDCWKETGELENILNYPEYNTDKTKEIVNCLQQYNTAFKSMEEATITGEIAVINLEQFNELDRKVLPEEYDEFSVFKEDKIESLNEFNVYGSGLELVKSLIENIRELGEESVGLAVHPDSKYQSLLESYFESENISYITQNQIDTSEQFRVLVNLMNTGLSDKTVRLKDVKPLTDALNLDTSGHNLNSRLDSVNGLEEFKQFLNVVEFLEVDEVIENLEELSGESFSDIRSLMNDLDMLNEPVSDSIVDKTLSFVDDFDIVSASESKGVLLADPRNTSTIDRPIVYMIGMDSSWSEKPKPEPWNNSEEIESLNAENFEFLIQSGDQTVYLVEDSADVRPCHYFEEIIPGFGEFRDHDFVIRTCKSSELGQGFERDAELEVDEEEDFILTQSRLNDLLISPRVFFMSQLVSDVEKESMKKGNLFHDFAELYFNHPEKTEERLDEITELFTEEMATIMDDVSLNKLETEINIGLKRIINFLSDKEPYKGGDYVKRDKYGNSFEEKLGIDIKTNSTEMTFNNQELGITGTVDLITEEDRLIDYKSGRKFSPKQIVEKSRVETAEDQRFPDVQALMYITQHSFNTSGTIDFSFVYFLEDLGQEVNGDTIEGIASTVTYHPMNFTEKIKEITVFESLFSDVKKGNNRRKTLEKLGYGPYKEFFEDNKFPEIYTKDEIPESSFAEEFISMCVDSVGDYKYVKKGSKSALKKLIEFRQENFFKEDVEKFEQFLEEKQTELKTYEEEKKYPVGRREINDLPEKDLVIDS